MRTWKAKTTKGPNPFSEPTPNAIAKTSKRRKIQFVKFRSVTGNEKTQNTKTRKITEKFRGVSRRFEAFRGVSRRFELCGKIYSKEPILTLFRCFWHLFPATSKKNASILACFLWFGSVSVTFLSGNENGISRRFEAFEGDPKSPKL